MTTGRALPRPGADVTYPNPPRDPPAEQPVRLALTGSAAGPQRLDGVWWPRSHDLGDCLPSLLAALEERWPGIGRVTVSRSMWRHRPESLELPDGRTVHITRSPADPDRHTIRLVSYGVGRCDLLVVPPGTAPDEARRLMAESPPGAAPAR
ncbi:DUF5994 family protein [Streptomyces sp. NBC_00669]|uniref:DUF5994 family protein n=1 Tax=Streptomyces sp. NBC_00669 TaxID=2976011 RepID=UPI002E301A9E|nr:DUF5994 family protein [Streptomyces sp. NBC_00669]